MGTSSRHHPPTPSDRAKTEDLSDISLEDEQERVSFSARSRLVRLEKLTGQGPLQVGALSAGEYLSIPDSTLVGRIGEWLARNGIARLAQARRGRGALPKSARPALLTAWKTEQLLQLAQAQPDRVAEGALDISPIRSRLLLMRRALTGRW